MTHRARSTIAPAFLLLASFGLLLPAEPATAADASSALSRDCSTYRIATGRAPELRVVNGHGELKMTRHKGRLSATLDGRPVPADRLQRDGKVVRVVDDSGATLFMVGVFNGFGREGQLAYTPDLDPWSLLRRYGLKTDEPDEELAAHLDVEPRTTLAVTEVCADRPAEAAGLRAADLIVGVGGKSLAADELVRMATALPSGEAMELDVLRGGQRDRVELVAGPVGEWPAADELEAYLLQVVHE